jgi:DNA-binding XRE family transcriptional regulator
MDDALLKALADARYPSYIHKSRKNPSHGRSMNDQRIDTQTLMSILRPLEVHQRVLMLRKLFNLSQDELGEIVDVRRITVSSWEAEPAKDRANYPSPEKRDLLAKHFRIPAYVLTQDYGIHNFQQAGMNLPTIEAGMLHPPEPEPQPLPQKRDEDTQWHEAQRQAQAQSSPLSALEGVFIPPSQMEPITKVEATPQQIVQKDDDPPPPPPDGAIRIG